MSDLLYILQCALVFGVPWLFGWVLLRRIFREANWVALVPGAMIGGHATLMALVNELRFAFEMRPAAWFAYKLLLVLTLLLLFFRPRQVPRARLPGSVDRRWKWLLVGLGAVGTAVYFGIPAMSGYLDDAWWFHYPAVVQIQDSGLFPLNHVFALDDPLYYHLGPDLLVATWSYLLDLSAPTAWGLYVAILAPCSFLLAFALLVRLCRSYWGALLGAAVLVAGGNLRFFLLPFTDLTSPLAALQVFNSQSVQSLLQMMFTPSHALGVPLTLLLLLLLRHVVARPSWLLAGTFGLLLGMLTLVAEWCFLPLVAGVTIVLIYTWARQHALRRTKRTGRLTLAIVPLCVAIGWGTFNNTYLAGAIGYFWMRYDNAAVVMPARQAALRSTLGLPTLSTINPAWAPPLLVPLRLNLTHFGEVPAWESAASNEGSRIPILGGRFLMESMPVLLLGLPFGCWLAWRKRDPVIVTLAWLAFSCALPPIFLDWGYRSTDLLRFFTVSYSFAAIFFGWFVSDLLRRASAVTRVGGVLLGASCLVTPVAVGIIGLMPGTLEKVRSIAGTAQSLSHVVASEESAMARVEALARQKSEDRRHAAFEKLAIKVGRILYPRSHGRERAIVIVPTDQIPKVEYFPEWMKMATLSRLPLPVGWHWQNSIYSAYYRVAVTELDPRAVAALDAKWVILSNVFQDAAPAAVRSALADPARFVPVATLHEGEFYMTAFRVRSDAAR
jgi:hypothetical protein